MNCNREVAEKTGIIVNVSECILEIKEYYENWNWVNHYFIGKYVGETKQHFIEREKSVGMEPRWISKEK